MITNELRALETGERVNLYTLDLTPIDEGAGQLYFHAQALQPGQTIKFQGIEYTPMPIVIAGFEVNMKGSPARPTMRVGNSYGVFSDLVMQYRDLVNAKVIRKTTFAQFLDDAPQADPLRELPSAIYRVERKVVDLPGRYIEFELSSFDFDGVQLPRRIVQPGTCSWRYRGEDCAYAGPGVDIFNRPATDPDFSGDTCGKTTAACKARHGALGNDLRFAGYPGTLRMMRVS